jgi:hypothetical protein
MTNRTPYQIKLNKMRDEFIINAASRPFDDNNSLAKLWFSTADVLINQLKTDQREEAGVVLRQLYVKPWPSDYDVWIKRWPEFKSNLIEGMARNKPK